MGERRKRKAEEMRVVEKGKGRKKRRDEVKAKNMQWANTVKPGVVSVPKWHDERGCKGIDYLPISWHTW